MLSRTALLCETYSWAQAQKWRGKSSWWVEGFFGIDSVSQSKQQPISERSNCSNETEQEVSGFLNVTREKSF
jgi:hypothetical protein